MRLEGFVKKGWGHELIWATNDKYCGKLMKFNEGAKFSMHFHKDKEETWYVLDGEFIVHWINTFDASKISTKIKQGDTGHNEPCSPHQLECLKISYYFGVIEIIKIKSSFIMVYVFKTQIIRLFVKFFKIYYSVH